MPTWIRHSVKSWKLLIENEMVSSLPSLFPSYSFTNPSGLLELSRTWSHKCILIKENHILKCHFLLNLVVLQGVTCFFPPHQPLVDHPDICIAPKLHSFHWVAAMTQVLRLCPHLLMPTAPIHSCTRLALPAASCLLTPWPQQGGVRNLTDQSKEISSQVTGDLAWGDRKSVV